MTTNRVLKHTFVNTQFLWRRSSGIAWLGPLVSSQVTVIKVLVGLHSQLEAQLEKNRLPTSFRIHFLLVISLRSPASCSLLAGGCSPVLGVTLPHRLLQHGCWLHPAHEESLQLQPAKMKPYIMQCNLREWHYVTSSIFYKLESSHSFCPHPKGRDYTKV